MKDHDVQAIALDAPFDVAFRYISNPATLPEWTGAFQSVSGDRARLATPRGAVDIGLRVNASAETGTIDWTMTFADGTVGRAFSRLVDTGARRLYIFVLLAPPVPLEELEGALAEQSRTLAEELATLQRKLGKA